MKLHVLTDLFQEHTLPVLVDVNGIHVQVRPRRQTQRLTKPHVITYPEPSITNPVLLKHVEYFGRLALLPVVQVLNRRYVDGTNHNAIMKISSRFVKEWSISWVNVDVGSRANDQTPLMDVTCRKPLGHVRTALDAMTDGTIQSIVSMLRIDKKSWPEENIGKQRHILRKQMLPAWITDGAMAIITVIL